MSETIRVEMEMPKPPKGFRYKGVIRRPKRGEFYLGDSGKTGNYEWKAECSDGNTINAYLILERAEPKARAEK